MEREKTKKKKENGRKRDWGRRTVGEGRKKEKKGREENEWNRKMKERWKRREVRDELRKESLEGEG